MLDIGLGLLLVIAIIGVYLLLAQQKERQRTKNYISHPPNEIRPMPRTFVPMEDNVVPTHASQTNKLNNWIGNGTSGIVGDAGVELVVPSDFYHSPYLPTDFAGPYWPSGTISPEYIYPGGSRRMYSVNHGTYEDWGV
jgi:hypothetical protein